MQPDTWLVASAGAVITGQPGPQHWWSGLLKRRPSKTTMAILELLFTNGCLPTFIIARRLGKPSRTVSSYLSHLRERGIVVYRDGCWELTEDGRRLAKLLHH